MSVGGKVIEVVPYLKGVWINTKENPSYNNTVAINVATSADSLSIRPGDKIWWQGNWAYWTKEDESIVEKRLERIGFSGVGRPKAEEYILENVQ